MLNTIKNKITDLAYNAVLMTEENLSTSSGEEKKAAAIDYIISMLPVSSIFKSIISIILSKFIDESVEEAVKYLKSIKNAEE